MYNIADKMIAGCKFDFAIFAILTLQIPIACFDMIHVDSQEFRESLTNVNDFL